MIFRRLFFSGLMLLTLQPGFAGEIFQTELRAEQWDIPRQGERLLRLPSLNEMINRWMQQPGDIIEIRYPGGEEGELWVNELMDWLVALGIPSKAMRAVPGSGAEDRIQLLLMTQL